MASEIDAMIAAIANADPGQDERIEIVRDMISNALRYHPVNRRYAAIGANAAANSIDDIRGLGGVPNLWLDRLATNLRAAIDAETVEPDSFRGGLMLVRYELALIRDKVKKGVYS